MKRIALLILTNIAVVVMLGIGEKSTPVGAFTARVNTIEDAPKAVATLLKALTRDASRT